VGCGAVIFKLNGVVCANFGCDRGLGLGACAKAWHGKCYVQHVQDKFPVLRMKDLDDALMSEEDLEDDDPLRFREARDGDHLLTSFQCDCCQFQNIQRRNPVEESHQDRLFMMCIRRAILDSFWSRERGTVSGNRQEGMRHLSNCDALGTNEPYQARGPFPVEDKCGIKTAVSLLLRSLDAGKNADTIQYETMRKLRSHMSNFVHTTPGGLGATFIAEDGKGGTVSESPTNSDWFKRFMRGCHKRMGDIWIPDRALTIREILCCQTLLEADWELFDGDVDGRLRTALTAVMLIGGFTGALRGEEIVRMDLGAMRKHWNESMEHPDAPHVPLMLAGRFKREIGEKLFCQPLALVSKSGLQIRLWMFRLIEAYGNVGIVNGPVFRKAGKTPGTIRRAQVGDLDPMFHAILKRVQLRWPSVIPDSVNVEGETSAFRSIRRGSTSEAQNAQLAKEIIEANNRWRKAMKARGLTPGMSMMERYSEARASVPTLIRYSGGI
jgi:hypothetical protein